MPTAVSQPTPGRGAAAATMLSLSVYFELKEAGNSGGEGAGGMIMNHEHE